MLVAAVFMLFLCAQVSAADNQGVLSSVESVVDDTHDKISDRFSSFVVQIDDFIGAGDRAEKLNTSWVRVRVDAVKPGDEKTKLRAKVKLRLVLPQSQKRFRLLLSTDDGEGQGSNSDVAKREQSDSDGDNGVAFALRFIRSAQKQFSLNYDVGARYREDKAQLFGRLNIAYRRESSFNFNHEFSNTFTYYSVSGFENRVRVDSRRLIFGRDNLHFRNSTVFDVREGNKGVGIGETIGVYADLSKRKALAFEGITGYATALNDGETERFQGVELRMRFRHSIWRPWFFYEIWPSVSWPSSNNFEKAYGGLVRLEVTLGNI